MAQFIHPENQRLLWDTLHKSPMIQTIDVSVRSSWFKSKIQAVYDQMGGANYFKKQIDSQQLDHLNRSSIKMMLQELKMRSQPGPPQQPPQQLPQYGPPPQQYGSQFPPQQQMQLQNQQQQMQQQLPPYQPRPNELSQLSTGSYIQQNPSRPGNPHNMDALQNVYMAKKNEMETMMSKKVPDQVDFSLKDKDEPISNMDEMVKKYMRERDLDVPMAAAPPQQMVPTMLPSEPNPIGSAIPINIVQSEPQNISITIHDDVAPPAPKRSVSFLDDTVLQYMKSMQDEMKEMRKQMNYMQEMITTAFPGSVATNGSHIEEISKDPIEVSIEDPVQDPIQDPVPESTEDPIENHEQDPEASPLVATEEN